MHKGLLFDLDGVIVDTAKYHYIAWRELAERLGIAFTLRDNERLKGVSRMRSFEIILEIGQRDMPEAEKERYCAEKNEIYLSYIRKMEEDEILPGVRKFLEDARRQDYRTALGSASRNAALILDRLKLADLFDAVVDGTMVSRAKPAPDVFLAGAEALCLEAADCIVFEDSMAGIEAAHGAGMKAVGIGTKEALPMADYCVEGFMGIGMDALERMLQV